MKRKSRNITKKLEPYVLFIEDEDDIRDAVVMSFIGRPAIFSMTCPSSA